MKSSTAIALLISCFVIGMLTSGCIAYNSPWGDHEWDFASGEEAIARDCLAVPGVTLEMCDKVMEKRLRHEEISGRAVEVTTAYHQDAVETICGIPLQKRSSARKN